MNRRYLFYLLTPICIMLIASCNNEEKPALVTVPAPKKLVIMDPFRFHKMIEVSPGQDYDILSWGRGSKNVGAFMILHSDSAAAKYTTTTGDLDGAIVDVYNSDMDLDGNPEIIIQARGKDSTNFATIYAFEFTGGKANKLDFPRLTKSQRKGYRGDDNFYIKDGILMREFPVYDSNEADAKPTGQKRQLQYGLRDNSFTVKQLSKDSSNVREAKPVREESVKSTSSDNSTKKTTKKSKKHTPEKKHKKKHRRHHSDED
jgi:hypothetical protein